MRSQNDRIAGRSGIDDIPSALIELCRTVDEAADKIADAIEPLTAIKDILGEIEKHLRRIGASA